MASWISGDNDAHRQYGCHETSAGPQLHLSAGPSRLHKKTKLDSLMTVGY